VAALTNGVERRLATEHQDDKGEGPQCVDVKALSNLPTARTPVQKASRQIPMMTPAIVKLPMRHSFGVGDGRTLSVVNDMERNRR